MTRTLDSNLISQLNSQAVKYAMFVELLFDTGTLRLHQAVGTINATESGGSARDWFGVGDLGTVGAVKEENNLQSHELELVMSGLDSTLLDLAINQNISNRLAKIFIGAFDGNDNLSGNLSFIARLRMDRMRVVFGDESAAVIIVCESEAASLNRTRHGYFSDDLQQRRFSGDKGFEYLAQLPFQDVVWAGKSVKNKNHFSPTPIQPFIPH